MNSGLPFQFGRLLVVTGVILVALGLLLMAGFRIGFLRLGRLPGDIAYKGKNVAFYFPIVTGLVLSVLATLILWLISFMKRL
jgi:Protein of unknown function (DUF2905)